MLQLQDVFLFVAGTMFIVRAELFKCLQTLELDFNKTNRKEKTSNAHVMERVFGGDCVWSGDVYC